MEGKYKLAEIKEILDGVSDKLEENNPFKKGLFDIALQKDKTAITNQKEFNRNIEVYKKLKEMIYLGEESITLSIDDSEILETINNEEARMIVEAMENKVSNVKDLLEATREKLGVSKNPKIVVYTCITGGYDNLINPTLVTQGVDYVCFTDNKDLKSKIWKIRPIPEELLGYSKVKQQRGVKILPHRYLPEYDISIWIDANVDTKGNLKEYLDGFDFKKYSVFIPEHPRTKCIYQEKDMCVKLKKITGDQIALAETQMKRYRDEGFPANYGLVQSNIVIRKHNDEYSKKLMELWWSELKDYSHRDQLSFNYALWKTGSEHFKYLIKTTCNSRVFRWGIGHRKK